MIREKRGTSLQEAVRATCKGLHASPLEPPKERLPKDGTHQKMENCASPRVMLIEDHLQMEKKRSDMGPASDAEQRTSERETIFGRETATMGEKSRKFRERVGTSKKIIVQ